MRGHIPSRVAMVPSAHSRYSKSHIYFFKMLSNVSNFFMYIFYCMCFYERKKKTTNKLVGGKKGFVLYFNWKVSNPSIMFTFMFSVVQSHDHTIQTLAFSESCCIGHERNGHHVLNLSLWHNIVEELIYWLRWDFLESGVRSFVELFMIVLCCLCGPKW